MLFNIYGDMGVYQLLAWVAVFVGLVLLNEIARRSKAGGVLCFIVVPAVLTVYFIAIAIGAAKGQDWALNNQTHVYQNSWFHYAKLYAATIGCIGFMFLKYKWGIGKKEWFKVFPFLIVAINILIAVASDFESAIKGGIAGGWWYSSENVWIYGGWWNWVNGIAGLINIFCMTGWWGIYSSKDEKDMLWPDMTWSISLLMTFGTLNIPTTIFRHTAGIAASLFFLLRLLQTHFGTRAVGFKTVQTHLQFGVCSLRFFRSSRISGYLFSHRFIRTIML